MGRGISKANRSTGTGQSQSSRQQSGRKGGGGNESKVVNINEARQARQRQQTADRGISSEKQLEHKQNISKLSDKQIDKMTRTQLLSWITKNMLAQVGEFFGPKTASEAKRRAELLAPSNSTAQLRKTLKNARKRFRQELKRG